MTHEEVYREIDLDNNELSKWWEIKKHFVAKLVKGMIRFPKEFWFEYETSRHNKYMVFCKVYSRKYEAMTTLFLLRKMERGYAIYHTRFSWQRFAKKIIILPHVFDRYSDPNRCNVRKSGIELIKEFVRYGGGDIGIHDNKLAGRSVRYNGVDNVCVCRSDGVLLGEQVDDIFIARTIITYEMANSLQKKEFEYCKPHLYNGGKLLYETNKATNCNEEFDKLKILIEMFLAGNNAITERDIFDKVIHILNEYRKYVVPDVLRELYNVIEAISEDKINDCDEWFAVANEKIKELGLFLEDYC